MPHVMFEFYIHGTGVDDRAWVLSQRIERHFGAPPEVKPPSGGTRGVDLMLALGILTLIATLPVTEEATLQLVDRLRRRESVRRALGTVRIIVRQHGVDADVDEGEAEEILDELAEPAEGIGHAERLFL